ncbi:MULTISPECIES: PilW family protein [Acinetobacter]|uniref:PilW family protein n=1 Tax=Acinetobacter TaxID=469 RepID=UPI0001B8E969|nr:PilW family protein [Acinetobacter sp. RUH 2624]EEW99652.1 prepilin-type N-terminal cleavage/methylation domain-containing protein [Acinetobacter sp. RUH 2624]
MNKIYIQQGFTLIELMITIVLGLLITAAAIQLFLTGQISLNTQRAMADLQESGNFGLRYISNDIRKTNYGNNNIINDRLANGGVVITTRQNARFPAGTGSTYTADTIPTNIPDKVPSTVAVPVTDFATKASNVQVSAVSPATGKVDQGSDQLVVQFFAEQAGVDCEGNNYSANRYIIERFFLRSDSNAITNEPNAALALACEAGSYTSDDTTILKNPSTSKTVFGTTDGEILVRRVDHLHFLLGVSDDTNTANFRYISIGQYLALNAIPRPRITSIQVGILVRSNESIRENGLVSNNQTYKVLDQNVSIKVPTGNPPKYLRTVITQTIALRNGLFSQDTAVM